MSGLLFEDIIQPVEHDLVLKALIIDSAVRLAALHRGQWDLLDDQAPNPKALGVKLWVNAYRSGDYVGRYLWCTDTCAYSWRGDCSGSPADNPTRNNSTDSEHLRLEFCIGAGAHTHYFDHTAPTIAAELDRLIALA